jgi:MFS family permease
VARIPTSMIALSIVLLVTATTGSYGRAGVITAVGTVTGACAAPLWGRLIDRIGQPRVLLAAGLLCNLSLTLLALTVVWHLPLMATVAAAVGVGLGYSSAGSCVRARWSHRLADSPLLNTAYAWEAVVDEGVFIVGPVLATFLATSLHPAFAVGACVVLGLTGSLALAGLRDTEPPVRLTGQRGEAVLALSASRLAPIVVASAALGALFGGMELAVVAFAREAGVLRYTGLMIMVWAVGSLVAGLVTGTVTWRVSSTHRFRWGAVLLACSVLPLPFAHSPWLVTGLLMVSGFFIAPTLIAAVAVTREIVPAARLNEALGWSSMGMATGVAAGAAGLGQILDLFGARAGFWAVLAIATLLIVAALCVRAPARVGDAGATVKADPEPAVELERS